MFVGNSAVFLSEEKESTHTNTFNVCKLKNASHKQTIH